MKERGKTIFRFSLSAAIVIVSVYFALKGIKLDELWNIMLSANYLWILLSVPVIILSHWVRAMRWKTMLEPALKTKSASTWNLFSAVMIGYAVNCVLPRGGEFIRPYVYSRREKVSFSTSFATIIAERFIDVITLIALFGVMFFFFSHKVLKSLPDIDSQKVLFPTLIVIGVLLISLYPPIFRFFIKILVKPFSKRLYERLSQIFEKFLKGFAVITTPSQYFRLTIESLAIWLFYTIPMYFMFFSFDFHISYHLVFYDAIILIIISGIGATIAPTPGAIGIYHVLIQNAMMRIYGISPEAALAYATLTHAINYIVQIGIGGVFFLRENVKKVPKNLNMDSELDPINSINQV